MPLRINKKPWGDKKLTWLVLVGFAALLPYFLLLDFGGQFYISDWYNSLWMIGYSGTFLGHHGFFPMVFNTPKWIGLPFPIFYGFLIYPLLGLLGAAITPDLALRAVILAFACLQFVLLFRGLRQIGIGRGMALGVACLAQWTIYPLTNVYGRGAISEVLSTMFLQCALFLLIPSGFGSPESRPWRTRLLVAAFVVLCVGTHSITGIYGTLFLALFLVLGWGRGDRKAIQGTAALGVVSLLIVSPWVYAVAKFQSLLYISSTIGRVPEVYGFESIASRLSPWPWDPRSLSVPGVAGIGAPYLDLQINLPILLFLVFVVILRWRRGYSALGRTGVFFMGLAALLFWLSLDPTVFDFLPRFLSAVQFGYRLIHYVNLSLLFALVAILARGSREEKLAGPMLLCLGLSLAAVFGKFARVLEFHAIQPNQQEVIRKLREKPEELVASFYGTWDYSTMNVYPAMRADLPYTLVLLPVHGGDQFGQVGEREVTVSDSGQIITNIEAFTWNRIVVDGTEVSESRYLHDHAMLGALVTPGVHRIGYRFAPDATWVALRMISWIFFVAVMVALAGAYRPQPEGLRRRTP